MISIIVPVFNCEKTISKCIESLLAQKSNEYEIIVVNNNSTDKTSSILKKYSNKYNRKISVYNEKIRSAYAARNLGLTHAKGDIIALTDADCFTDSGWLINLTNPLKNKHIKLSGGVTKSQSLSNNLLKYCDKFCNMQQNLSSCHIPFFGGGNMAFRKKDAEKIGYFPIIESGGDVIFCSKLVNNIDQVKFVKNAVVYHKYEDSFFLFLKKQYYYGKWHTYREKKFKLSYKVNVPSYYNVIKKYGFIFLFFRFSQDIAYFLGSKL